MKKISIGPEERTQLRKQLKKINFLSYLPSVDVDALASQTKLFEFDEGDTIFKQGEKPGALYLILEGRVAVKYKKGIFKKADLLEELGAGHFFGEMALIDGSRRTASVKTLKTTKLFVVGRDVIDEMLIQNEKFRDHIRAVAETRKFLNSRHT